MMGMAPNPIADIESRLQGHDATRVLLYVLIVAIVLGVIANNGKYTDRIDALEKRIEQLEQQKEKAK